MIPQRLDRVKPRDHGEYPGIAAVIPPGFSYG
jgi:hypothetical protein